MVAHIISTNVYIFVEAKSSCLLILIDPLRRQSLVDIDEHTCTISIKASLVSLKFERGLCSDQSWGLHTYTLERTLITRHHIKCLLTSHASFSFRKGLRCIKLRVGLASKVVLVVEVASRLLVIESIRGTHVDVTDSRHLHQLLRTQS